MPSTDPSSFQPGARPVLFRVRRIPPRQAARTFCALVFATLVCLGMVFTRSYYFDSGRTFHYLVWNLMLAWIPLVFSFAAYRFYAHRNRRSILFALCAVVWFLFFPNAPYLTTDVVHILDDHVSASWFHLLCIMSYAWTGLSLGYISLYLMQEVVRARCGWVVSWFFVLLMLGAAALGVYLGRFLRWNSWDVLRDPVGYLRVGYHDTMPFAHPGRLYFMVMMFLFMLLSYGILHALTHLHEPEKGRQ